jgi:hypothetical protein
VIVFSAFLVVVAVALLVAGVVTSKLVLVYVAIGVSGVSLLALGLGALLRRKELFGQAREAAPARPHQVLAQGPPVEPDLAELPQPAAAPAGYGWSAVQPGPAQAGYLPPAVPSAPSAREGAVLPAADSPPAAVERPRSPAQQIWEWRGNLPEAEPERPPAASPAGTGPFDDQPTRVDLLPIEDRQPAETDQATWELPAIEPTEPAPSDQPDAHVEEPAVEKQPTEEQPTEEQPTEEPAADAVAEEAVEDQAVEDQAVEDQAVEDQVAADAPAADTVAADPVADAPAEDQQQAPPGHDPESAPAEVDLLREVTVVPGVPRYHSAQCILIRFMGEDDLNKMSLGEARQAGCTPCRACQPDQA